MLEVVACVYEKSPVTVGPGMARKSSENREDSTPKEIFLSMLFLEGVEREVISAQGAKAKAQRKLPETR